MEDEKLFHLEKSSKSIYFWFWEKENSLRLEWLLLYYMDVDFGVATYLENIGGKLSKFKRVSNL